MITASDFEDEISKSGENYTKPRELITGIHCFVAMAELTVILNEVLSVFFTISSVLRLRDVSGGHIVEVADKITTKLDHWRSTYLDQVLTQRFFPDITGEILSSPADHVA